MNEFDAGRQLDFAINVLMVAVAILFVAVAILVAVVLGS